MLLVALKNSPTMIAIKVKADDIRQKYIEALFRKGWTGQLRPIGLWTGFINELLRLLYIA